MPSLQQPHNLELEEAVLGGFALRPELLTEPWAEIPTEAFYSETHRRVLTAIRALQKRFGPPGVHYASVAFELRNAGHPDDALSLAGMASVYEHHVKPATTDLLPMFTAQLLDLYRQRASEILMSRAHKRVLDGENLGDVQLELDAVMTAINSTGGTPEALADEEILERMEVSRMPSGYEQLDRLTHGGLVVSGLNILAARVSVGKSALARGIIRNNARRGVRVFWYSQDQAESQIYQMEISRALAIPTHRVLELTREQKLAGIRKVRDEVWGGNVALTSKPLMLPDLLTAAKTTQPGLVVIDYLQAVKTKDDSAFDQVSRVADELKDLSLRLDVPVLALAQLNRDVDANEEPQLSHLKQSGRIEEAADQVWMIQRDTSLTGSAPATVHVKKAKTGPVGRARLMWHGDYASYENMADPARVPASARGGN